MTQAFAKKPPAKSLLIVDGDKLWLHTGLAREIAMLKGLGERYGSMLSHAIYWG